MTRYAELHCKTNFSFLRAASHPDELVERAVELGYAALAVTDRESVAGAVEAHIAAKKLGLKLLIGAEIVPRDAPPVVLLATDRAAYGRLARLLTLGKRRAAKGECLLDFADLAEHAEGLIACIVDAASSRVAPATECGKMPHRRTLPDYRDVFGDRCYLAVELFRGDDDERRLAQLSAEARRAHLPPIAAGDVRYHAPFRQPLQDVLTAVRLGRSVAECGRALLANAERHLHPLDEIAARFAAAPQLIARTVEVADRCTFSLDELRYEYPEELAPPGIAPPEHLKRLTWQGASERYPAGVPDKVRRLLEHELALVEELRYEAYFLTVWDLVRFARSRGILCQGRGSAANSAVCYCLGVTSVDPDRADVLFERFISRERNEPPDIDVDFEHERREEVLQYVYDKYGRDRAALTAETIRYRGRSAAREVGKALGLAPERIEALAAAMIDHRNVPTQWRQACLDAGLDPDTRIGRQFIALAGELLGFPRHRSQHVGGMVISRGPLSELVPIENAAMPRRTVIEWNKDDLDALGLLKVDCLALGMLTAIRKCFELVERSTGRRPTLATVPAEDPAVYEMISRADTMGVFQIESRAQMSMLPRLRPKEFYDLVIEVAIVRPGPIQGNMVHPYLRRRAGDEPITYPNDAVREVLHKTLGVPIFQEQAMRLAVAAAGFTPGEADQLRRAMAAWRRSGAVEKFRDKLVDGMRERGLSDEFAENVYKQICGFGEYGFPESHAASFALLVYVSAWLKHYHPAEFCAALVNSQPMGFYAPAQLIRNAQEHGVEVRPIDVNRSDWDVTLETGNEMPGPSFPISHSVIPHSSPALRLGLRQIKGLPEAAARRIVAARAGGAFRSVADLALRAKLGRPVLEVLARAQAFGSLGLDRRAGLWQSLAERGDDDRPLLADARRQAAAEPQAAPTQSLPPAPPLEEVLVDYRTTGLSLRAHPMSFVRALLDGQGVARASALAQMTNGKPVRVAGVVLLRQRPGTAKGITFVTLEDETGTANLVVRPDVWQRDREAARTASAWVVEGRLQREREVIHVVATRLRNLAELTQHLDSQSRDFR